MKKILKLAINTLTLSLLLVSCTTSNATNSAIPTQSPTPAPLAFTQDAEDFDILTTHNDNFYFYSWQPYQDEYSVLNSVNSLGELQYICDIENCTHSDESCNAFNSSFLTKYIFYTNDKLYATGTVHPENSFIDNNIVIHTFEEDNFKNSTEIFRLDDYILMGHYEYITAYENYVFMLVRDFHNEFGPSQIIKVNLDNGDYEFIYDIPKNYYSRSFEGIVDGCLIFVCETDTSINIFSIDLNTNMVTEIFSNNNANHYIISDNYFYSIELEYVVNRTDIFTGEKTLLFDLSPEGIKLGSFIDVYDEYFTYSTSQHSTKLALNTLTMQTAPITLNTADSAGIYKSMVIVAVYEEHFLVVEQFHSALTRKLSIISKEDYFAGNPNFTTIGAFPSSVFAY